ncbi:ABC transporter substrate-binding protein [Glycomyces tenuis]|uniref:ABC transporter substrate-binding protein n=1 Tax=Glycomyces tenuis TaxID=58116 RepID=UPI00040BBFE0|nr:sugar ABC transporter substrate-binding protein [Glycomyces tenuis]
MSTSQPQRLARRTLFLASGTGLLGAALTACGDDAGPAENGEPADLDAALEEGGELTYWTWTPSGQAQVDAFMAAHPNVTVELVNAGTGTDQYTALQNAVAAGSGAPDVAQIEYYALQQFALSEALVDLTQYGFADFEADYTASTWSAVNLNGGVYGLPQDSGPLVMAYNQAVFDEFGIAVPATWEEYITAAEALHTADADRYLTNDAGDAGYAQPLIWQADGRPYEVDGENVTIDLQDEGTRRWADAWNRMLEPGLLAPIPTWSDDWWQALSNGTIASLITGAWIPGILQGSVPDGAGHWRIAPVPSYDGSPATSENGGSAQSVLQQSKNPALAAAFLRWLNHSEDSVGVFLDSGGFPATTADLESEEFLGAAPEYFGGQQINQVLVEAAGNVEPGFQYLPFQVYANSIFPDTVGTAYVDRSDLNTGLQAWQEQLVTYGNSQGFKVN